MESVPFRSVPSTLPPFCLLFPPSTLLLSLPPCFRRKDMILKGRRVDDVTHDKEPIHEILQSQDEMKRYRYVG